VRSLLPLPLPLQRSYAEANNGFYEGPNVKEKGSNLSRDDRVHGSMLIINELIMNCAWSDEVGVVIVVGVASTNVVNDHDAMRLRLVCNV